MSGRGENAGVSEPLKSTDHFRRAMRNRDLSSGARVWTRMLLLSLTVALTCPASEPSRHVVTRATPDPYIAAALRQISSARIQANIMALVGFGTGSTLSAQDPGSIAAGRGIGAARDWIRMQFVQYSKDCGACLDVKIDAFTQPPAERVQ